MPEKLTQNWPYGLYFCGGRCAEDPLACWNQSSRCSLLVERLRPIMSSAVQIVKTRRGAEYCSTSWNVANQLRRSSRSIDAKSRCHHQTGDHGRSGVMVRRNCFHSCTDRARTSRYIMRVTPFGDISVRVFRNTRYQAGAFFVAKSMQVLTWQQRRKILTCHAAYAQLFQWVTISPKRCC